MPGTLREGIRDPFRVVPLFGVDVNYELQQLLPESLVAEALREGESSATEDSERQEHQA